MAMSWVGVVLMAGPGARAGDRPYLATTSAAAEEDDDDVWSVESWFQRIGSVRTLTVAPEYAFSPTTSLQIEAARFRNRNAGGSMSIAELEFKHLFNHIARDGYGWGVAASVGFAKPSGQSMGRDEWGLTFPFTLSLWDGGGQLHLNAGASWPRGEGREWNASVSLEGEVWRRTTLYGELARLGDVKLLHAGMRYWVRREKLAFDVSLQRLRGDGSRERGIVIGVGVYDL